MFHRCYSQLYTLMIQNLFLTGKNVATLIDINMNKELSKFKEWLHSNKLSLNDKTQIKTIR